MSTTEIRWVVTGAGDVCERKSGPPLYQLPGHSLLAITRRNAEAGEAFAAKHRCRYIDHVEELFSLSEATAVYVATPHAVHREHTVAAARTGKHVLVEKPMAANTAECDEMIQACREAGVVLGVAYYRRCYPSILRAKELLEQGAIGTLVHIEINDQFPASHRLDLMHFFAGDIATIRSETRELPPKSHAAQGERLSGTFCNGGTLSMNIGWHESGPPEQVRITGSEGEIFIDDLKGGSLEWNGTRETFAPLPWTHWGLIENFGLHVQGRAPLACTGEEGRKSTVVLDFASTLVADGDPVDIDYDHPPDPDWMKAQGFNLLG